MTEETRLLPVKKPIVKWSFQAMEWEVRRGGRLWYGSRDWREAYDYALVLARFQAKGYDD